MRIHPATRDSAAGTVTIRYRFESAADGDGELWFRLPARYEAWLHTGPEPAVAALAFAALARGEDLVVAEPVSARFHYGFQHAVAHFRLWWPALQPIALHAPDVVPAAPADGGAVVSCFSGGVDSFHTLYAHLGAAAPNDAHRLTHLCFAHGFDIPLADSRYTAIADEFDALADALGLALVRCATNARAMLDPHLRWDQTHGAVIAATALLLSGGVRRFLVPSTNRQSLLFLPCGSNPVTDPMFASERLDIVHYGTHASRIEKIVAIAPRREAQQHLRVCWQNDPARHNCGRCMKCLKTMMPLAVIGQLAAFEVFPPRPDWRAVDFHSFTPVDLSASIGELSYAEELRGLAAAHGFALPWRTALAMRVAQLAPLARLGRRWRARRARAASRRAGEDL